MSSLPVALDRTLHTMFGPRDMYTRDEIQQAMSVVSARLMCARTTEVTASVYQRVSRDHHRRMSAACASLECIADTDSSFGALHPPQPTPEHVLAGRTVSLPNLHVR